MSGGEGRLVMYSLTRSACNAMSDERDERRDKVNNNNNNNKQFIRRSNMAKSHYKGAEINYY